MVLTASLIPFVAKGTRERGREYFLSRRVTIVEGDEWYVGATVRGSRTYDVQLVREPESIDASCSCPFCRDSFELCKHIWATLLAAEVEGFLKGDGRRPARYLNLADT